MLGHRTLWWSLLALQRGLQDLFTINVLRVYVPVMTPRPLSLEARRLNYGTAQLSMGAISTSLSGYAYDW